MFNHISWEVLPRRFRLPKDVVIFLSGPLDWCLSVYQRGLAAHPCLLSAEAADHPNVSSTDDWLSFQVHHLQVGGVLDGQWVFYINPCWVTSFPHKGVTPRAAAYNRRLRHVIESTDSLVNMRACPPPADDSAEYRTPVYDAEGVLNWNSPLPLFAPLTRVCCRCTYSSTGWVHRRLSPVELGRSFDVPSCLLSWCQQWSTAHAGALPFLRTAPPRTLSAACLMFMDPPHSEDSGGGGSLLPSLAPPAQEEERRLQLGIEDRVDEREEALYAKATKADDAAVPVELWDEAIWGLNWHDPNQLRKLQSHPAAKQPLNVIRRLLAYCWRRNVLRSFIDFMQEEHGLSIGLSVFRVLSTPITDTMGPECAADLQAGKECVRRVFRTDWWDWGNGSRLLFWRWPKTHRKAARDGYPAFVSGDLPRYRKPQPQEKDASIVQKVGSKLTVVRGRGYISPGPVKSLTGYFSVKKGESDIRMVYDASKSGLNKALWAPNFGLPTVNVLTRAVDEASWMGDLDIGEMFLNFCLDPHLQEYCGVDLRPYFSEEVSKGLTLWERWVRCMMGLKISPYVAVKGMLLAMEVVFGDKDNPKNVYRWKDVVLNLPGMASYDPTRPKVWRRKNDQGDLAATTVGYVDDLRPVAGSKEECWSVMNQTGARLSYLGIQCAARKTRPPSQTPGAWAGSVVVAREIGVGVKCTQEKWDKAKRIVAEIDQALKASPELDRKMLERHRGFLIHIQGTYPAMTPYLKGIHQRIDSWRPGRDADGWKRKVALEEILIWDEETRTMVRLEQGAGPALVTPVPRLADDVACLLSLFNAEAPPLRLVRSKHIAVALYGFGDASGVGFGSTIQTAEGIMFRHGVWGRDSDSDSSNYRELNNLILAVEDGVAQKELEGAELYIFTDNSTAESVFYKGNSTSRRLFELMLRLRKVEMTGKLRLQVIHIAGTRMISQGTDGISRGVLTEGLMEGMDMLQFIPLHKSALERQPSILNWVREWADQPALVALTPTEWFTRGHGIAKGSVNAEGIWIPGESSENWKIWAPAPAAAEVAVEELNTSRHKRTHINHVFIAPRLMTHTWRKRLQKLSDFVFEVPAGARSFWPKSEHEPLIIGLTLRFSHCRPWQVKQSDCVLGVDRQLRAMWKDPGYDDRDFLRKLCGLPGVLDAMQDDVVR